MKKSASVKMKNFLSVFLALLMAMTVFAVPVSAASSSKSASNSKVVTVNVRTGSGFQYALGWKKTQVTITNTSKSGAISVYTPVGACYYVQKGRSVTFNLYGSGKTFKYGVQRSGIGTRSFKVTTNAGSVW